MRKLAVLSFLLLTLVAFSIWLVHPMFVAPAESRLVDCVRCEDLLALVPERAAKIVIVPRAGTTLFELGRRMVPGKEITDFLPAPGLLAIALDEAPLVGWQDESGRLGAVAAPSGLRRILLRIAAVKGARWTGDLVVLGDAGSGPGIESLAEIERLESERGHVFSVHDVPSGRSAGRITPGALELKTWPRSSQTGRPRRARHPDGVIASLEISDLQTILGPIEKLLPIRSRGWSGTGGQLIVYGVDTSGLLPRLHGLVLIDGAQEPMQVIERVVPHVDGMTQDTLRQIGDVEIFRRETLGVVVEGAEVDGRLALALDEMSMEEWLTGPTATDPDPSIWSFQGDPGAIADAVDGLAESPARYLLSSASRKKLGVLRSLVGPFRTASRVESRLVATAGGHVIESSVEW